MTKNTTTQYFNTITPLDFLKKLKQFNLLEPFLAFLGFTLVACLFIACFFYLNYQAVIFHGFPWFGLSAAASSALQAEATALNVNQRLGFLEEGGHSCDIYDGKWVWDDNYPLYQSPDCPFIDSGFRCLENGRPDSFYTKWRWQPKGCNLPRFNATKMLEKLRNRHLAFIGDSIGRNQWESMLCMLSSVIPSKDSIYEVNGSPITKHKGLLVFRFADYNCTVEYYRAPFLVAQGSAPRGSSKGVRMTLRLDPREVTSDGNDECDSHDISKTSEEMNQNQLVKIVATDACLGSLIHGMSFFMHFSEVGVCSPLQSNCTFSGSIVMLYESLLNTINIIQRSLSAQGKCPYS
ncbi:hypothetical protein CRYUN_Cryun14cG0099800 [Craigia yunnanensis]